jgi:hypothetical protein
MKIACRGISIIGGTDPPDQGRTSGWAITRPVERFAEIHPPHVCCQGPLGKRCDDGP